MIIVVIPAHNEADNLPATIGALRRQSTQPDRIMVVADNCTDNTTQISENLGAEVFVTWGNEAKKAGALNQALAALIPTLTETDYVLIQDGDTALNDDWITVAVNAMRDPAVGAVGAVFFGEPGFGLIGALQRNEYQRYCRELDRSGKVAVLSGTGAMFRVQALQDLQHARFTGRIPGGHGVYQERALTEDNEVTLALKTLGWELKSPAGCHVVTEIMPNLHRLWVQRLRWTRGAFDNLRSYGWTDTTRPYILKQALQGGSVVALSLYLLFMIASLIIGHLSFSPLWFSVGLVFLAERVITVRKGGWRGMILASFMLPEIAYDLFQHAVYVKSLTNLVMRRNQMWS